MKSCLSYFIDQLYHLDLAQPFEYQRALLSFWHSSLVDPVNIKSEWDTYLIIGAQFFASFFGQISLKLLCVAKVWLGRSGNLNICHARWPLWQEIIFVLLIVGLYLNCFLVDILDNKLAGDVIPIIFYVKSCCFAVFEIRLSCWWAAVDLTRQLAFVRVFQGTEKAFLAWGDIKVVACVCPR